MSLFTFPFGCGCSRTCIYFSAKWSRPTLSVQGFKFAFLLKISCMQCSEYCKRAAFGGEEKMHAQLGWGQNLCGNGSQASSRAGGLSLDSRRRRKLCKSKDARAETWGGPSPPLSEGLSGCALSGCSNGWCSRHCIHSEKGVFSHFPQSRWVGHLEVARESPFSCTSVSDPSESPLDSSKVQFLPTSTALGPDQVASLFSCPDGCDGLLTGQSSSFHALFSIFVQHLSFKSTDLTVLLTCISPFCASFLE